MKRLSSSDYPRIKNELRQDGSSYSRYFTKAFFSLYLEALETLRRNEEAGVDDLYDDNGILTRHAWDAVRRSDFYLKNGSAYCRFLEIVH